MHYTKDEKVKIVVNIIKKLKSFPAKNGSTIDLYNKEYSYVEKLKDITMKWINEANNSAKGMLYFEELNKYFEYNFPDNNKIEPLFVLRKNTFFD